MPRIPEIVPVTDLRQNSAEVLERLRDSREPIVITQRGRAAAVMVSVEAFEERERDWDLLRVLLQSEREIQAGEGAELDEVLAEAEAILAE